MSRIFLTLIALFLMAAPASAELKSAGELDAIKAYFNSIKTLSANFYQTSTKVDGLSKGQFFLDRRMLDDEEFGKLKIDYDPPTPIQFITVRDSLVYFDKDLDQATYLPIEETPAILLTQKGANIEDVASVSRIIQDDTKVEVEFKPRDEDIELATMTLIFNKRPFQLSGWQVTDYQGIVTRISLADVNENVDLGPETFRFVDPRFRTLK